VPIGTRWKVSLTCSFSAFRNAADSETERPDAAGLGGAIDAEIRACRLEQDTRAARPSGLLWGRPACAVGVPDEPRIGFGFAFDHLVPWGARAPFPF